MSKLLKRMFVLPGDPDTLREDQILKAKLLALDHRAAAERELALAEMYEKQVSRLRETASV